MANGDLQTRIVAQHLVAAKVHAIGSRNVPLRVEAISAFNHEAGVLVCFGEGLGISAPPFLPCGQHTIRQARAKVTVEAQMKGHEAVVQHAYHAIIVVYRRAI